MKVTDRRKVNPFPTWAGKWDGEPKAQDYQTESWPHYSQMDHQKVMEAIEKAWYEGMKTYSSSRPGADVVYLPVELDWLKVHLDIQHWEMSHDSLTVVGLVNVDRDTPDSDKAAVVYYTSKFLRVLDLLREKKVTLTQLPSITIGQVSGGYQARVEIIVRLPDSY